MPALLTNREGTFMLHFVILALLCTGLIVSAVLAWTNRDILIGLLTHGLEVSLIDLNLWEDPGNSYSIKSSRQRLEQAASCTDGPSFPASPYFRSKPRLLEDWPIEGIALMRVSKDYRSRLDKGSCWSVCGDCKFITYHNIIPGTNYRYAQIKAILFDCKANCYGITALAEKVYKKTGMPSLILSRSIARIHLYINRRMICLADSGDLGFDDLVVLLERSAR